MADKLAVLQSEQTVKELEEIEKSVEKLVSSVKKLYDEMNVLSKGFGSGTPKEFANSVAVVEKKAKEVSIAQKEVVKTLTELEKLEKRITKAYSEEGKALQSKKQELQAVNQENRKQANDALLENKRLLSTVSLYKKVELSLNSLRNRYNELAIKKQLGIELTAKEERRMVGLEKAMKKYDSALKAVDASGGKFNRNVGNYASGFNAMNNSIAQLTREMPAFANSVQTGFMALSNNIPIFFDTISQARKENAALTAEGKKGVPVWRQVVSGILSWNTALSISVVLLTVYGKDIVEWTKKMISSNSATYQAKKNLEDLNSAKKEAAKNSASEITQLNLLYRVATNAALSYEQRMRAVRKLQDLYPSYFANMSAESIMLGKAIGQYKELSSAIIASARAKSIQAKLEERQSDQLTKEEELQQKLNDAVEEGVRLKKSGYSETELVRDGQGGLVRKEISNQELLQRQYNKINALIRQRGKLNKQFYEENKFLIDEAIKYENQAAQYESDKYGKDATKSKSTKGKATPDLTKEQRSYLDDLAAMRDDQIAIQKEAQVNGEITEKQYWEEYIKIIKTYRQKVMDYLNGENAKQRKIEAGERKRAIEAIEKANKEIYDYEKAALDSYKKLKDEKLQNELDLAKNDPYTLEAEKIQKQSKVYDEMIVETNLYYQKLIDAAKKYRQDTANLENERDAKVTDIQGRQTSSNANLPNAIQSDVAYYQQIEDNYRNAANAEERRAIITKSRLSDSMKAFLLSVKEKEQNLELLNIDKERLVARQDELIAKGKSSNLTIAEQKELAKVTEEVAKTNEQIDIMNKALAKTKAEQFREQFGHQLAYIRDTLHDFGLDNFSAQFDDLVDKLINKTLNWKDAAVGAATIVADALNMVSEAQKQKTIEMLDEQLRASQESTELELSFINSRLEALNNLQERTAEQNEERNALEDEARTLKEQQAQREKQIATQKAKAEQRAAAQQALINGLLAATMALATQSPPGSYIMAAVSAAMGVAMAASIMSKNPVPQYFVGRKDGEAEWAYTQERGAEIITDKKGNIKTFGSDSGAKMTWLDRGDKVYTAEETKKYLSSLGDVDENKLYRKIAMKDSVPMVVLPTQRDDSDKIISGVGKQFDRVMNKYDKEHIFEKNGNIYSQKGGEYPIYLGKSKIQKTVVNINNSRKDVRY